MEKNYYKEYYHLEREHWWFKARLKILRSTISTKIINGKNLKLNILNAGVATGITSIMLEEFGKVTSLEYDEDCCKFLKETLKIDVINGSLTELPFEDNTFDLVCAFDVIEHIKDDELAIKEIRRVLKTNGKIFLTVPAYKFLWSHHDVVNHHFRRYTLKDIRTLFQSENFNIIFGSYFNFILFLPIAASRLVSNLFLKSKMNKSINNTGSDFEVLKNKPFINNIFYGIFKGENFFLNKNIKFPFGVSIMIVGIK